MNLVSLIHKGLAGDSTMLPADQVVRMVTENAAAAVGMKDQIGTIKDGANADLIFIDLNEPSMFPNNNIVSSLCYSANGSEVDSVMIDGRFVMRKREFVTMDGERVRFEVQRIVDKYL
jgi:5-methylthioadenosine/S-adenosylhomocysteine deaminase